MRVVEICPTCATYINAACIIYNGDYLTNLDVAPLTSLDEILGNINDAIPPLNGEGNPTDVPVYIGQLYIDTTGPNLWIGLGTSSANWGLIGVISTTTTTTSTSTTTTTTTIP